MLVRRWQHDLQILILLVRFYLSLQVHQIVLILVVQVGPGRTQHLLVHHLLVKLYVGEILGSIALWLVEVHH